MQVTGVRTTGNIVCHLKGEQMQCHDPEPLTEHFYHEQSQLPYPAKEPETPWFLIIYWIGAQLLVTYLFT